MDTCCCHPGASDPRTPHRDLRIWCPSLLQLAYSCLSPVGPLAAMPQTGNSHGREDIKTQFSMFFVLWSRSLGQQCRSPFLEISVDIPYSPHSCSVISAPHPRYSGRIHRKLLKSTSKSFQDFMLIFCSESNPAVSSTWEQEDQLKLNTIHVGHCDRIINILALCPWFLAQNS